MLNHYKNFRIIILIIGILVIAYFGFMLIGGGFGRKPVNIDAMNDGNSPFLFAHRGISEYYPENTREAIDAAKLKGFKGLEIDIRKSSDDEFILFHDEDCSRLLGIQGKIDELSTTQIKERHVLFDGIESDSYVLTLRELLDNYKDDFIFYFDMKLKDIDDIDELVSIVLSYDISGSSIIASTSGFIVFYIEYNYPEIKTALEGFNSGKEWLYSLFPKNFKPDYLSSFAGKVDEKHISWLRQKNLVSNRIVYDVDSANYQKVIQLGMKNLIIDYDSTMTVP
jgi:glycerophosphoryl diester phosphodiesterase